MEPISSGLTGGLALTSTGTSVTSWIPKDSSGLCPRYIRLSATAPGYVRLSDTNTNAQAGDLMIQPQDATVVSTNGLRWIGFISVSGTATLNIQPLEYGGLEYSSLPLGAVLDLDFANDIYQVWG